ncbi:MAG: DNA-processing protein DprA [Porphyromonadaceae bacterium]|nr:DNA-processing protein DprA [Porphyromonadaceae bacterium]
MVISYNEKAVNILAALSIKGIGRSWIIKHQQYLQSVQHLVAAIRGKTQSVNFSELDFIKLKNDVISDLRKLESHCDGIVCLGDKDFPYCRGIVPSGDLPVVLFYRGDLRLLQESNKNVAVIGLLSPDEKIELAEKIVIDKLSHAGATILSGLALGCDSTAHKQAITSGTKTIAVLPSPLFDIIPQSNRVLAEEIIRKGGLLVTEYYQPIRSKKELTTRYIERDRLQALFCDYIVLAASYAPNNEGKDSGARHAMDYAKKYGIPRAVIYNEHKHDKNPMFDLNRLILKDDSKVYQIDSLSLDKFISQIRSEGGPAKQSVSQDEEYGIFSPEDFL